MRARWLALGCGLAACLAGGVSAAIVPDPRAAEATGTMRILVVRATWGPMPSAPDDGRRALDQATVLYARASFGRLKLAFDLTPWLKAYAGETCLGEPGRTSAYGQLGENAQHAARAAGYDLSQYARLVYVLPDRVCSRGGLGVGREVLLAGSDALEDGFGLVHELGHTFGLPHATRSGCPRGCPVVEYGDPLSPMGQGSVDFTGLEKVKLGWIDAVTRAEAPGTYAVGPVDEPSDRPQVLVVRAAAGEYWIERRAGVPHIAVRVVAPNAPRHPTYLRSIFLGSGDHRYAVPGVLAGVARSDGPEAGLTFQWIDRASPSRPRIRAAHVASGTAIVTWSAAQDDGSGLAIYRVLLDGRQVETTTRTRTVLAGIGPRSHWIAVEAVDRAGNRARSGPRILPARSTS